MISAPASIIAAVDFGDASGRAVAAAGAIAVRCRAGLTLLHAESPDAPAYFTAEQVDALERQRHALHVQAEQFLLRFGRRYTQAPFSVTVDSRPPVEAIVHASAAADLIVMGTHGRHGPKRWWLGSVAERVLRDITRPLLVVHANSSEPIDNLFERSVLVGYDGTEAVDVSEYARALVACFGGQLSAGRDEPIETIARRTRATIAIVPAPQPKRPDWLAHYGEPLVRHCTIPILFVPTIAEGVTS
jgi:nucleotide-binding universal stress UspA family protein